jgi:hypothetical protein
MIGQRDSLYNKRYFLCDSVSEGLKRGDIPAGSDHLRHKQEANGGSQHVGGYAGEIVSIVLKFVQLLSVELATVPVNCKRDCHHQKPRLHRKFITVAYSRKRMKYLWLSFPTQLPTHGQWWSIRNMHFLHILQ